MAEDGSFPFVNMSNPLEYLDPANRKLVRRNATMHRSRNRRARQTPEASDAAKSPQPYRPGMGVRLQLYPVKMEKYMYESLEYTEHVIFPSLFPLKTMYRYHPAHQMTMSLVLQDPKVLHSQVAMASYHNAVVNGNGKSSMFTALKHQSIAIGLMKDWLASTNGSHADDVGATLCITHLASLELMTLNFDGWNMHMDALRSLAENPSTNNLLSIAQFAIIDCELCGCYLFNKQPSFVHERDLQKPELDFFPIAPPDSDEALHRKENLISLCSGNEAIFAIDDTVLSLVLELQNLTKNISIPPTTPIPYPDLYIRTYVTSRIAAEYTLFHILAAPELTPFSRTICLALQTYINRVLRTFARGTTSLHGHAERIRKSIEDTLHDLPAHIPQPTCMLWVGVMGALAAKDGALRDWFVEFVHTACWNAGFGEWADVYGTVSQFVWPEQYLDEEAAALWAEVADFGGRSQMPLLPHRFVDISDEGLDIS